MTAKKKSEIIAELREIPGVDISIAHDLYNIGIRTIADLRSKNPDRLYEHSNAIAGTLQDRCLLYVFREAVYYAKTPAKSRDPEKLKWWNWKDDKKPRKKSNSVHLIGPTSTIWLQEAGVHTVQDIEQLGSVQVYLRVKRLYPKKVSLNLLYALEASRLGISWIKLSSAVKRQLKTEATEILRGR